MSNHELQEIITSNVADDFQTWTQEGSQAAQAPVMPIDQRAKLEADQARLTIASAFDAAKDAEEVYNLPHTD